MKKTLAIAFMLVLVLGMATAEDKKDKQAAKKDADVPAQEVKPAAPASEEYVIGPEDVLHVNVWKEPELSQNSVSVRSDGKISMPLLNDIQASGSTPTQLAASITEKLKQYVTDPRVTVTVIAMNSRRIFMMGEVARAGAYPMLPNMTLIQALSAGGGFSPYANLKKMYLLRTEGGKQVKIPINYKALISGSAPEQNIPLKPGDTIVVP